MPHVRYFPWIEEKSYATYDRLSTMSAADYFTLLRQRRAVAFAITFSLVFGSFAWVCEPLGIVLGLAALIGYLAWNEIPRAGTTPAISGLNLADRSIAPMVWDHLDGRQVALRIHVPMVACLIAGGVSGAILGTIWQNAPL